MDKNDPINPLPLMYQSHGKAKRKRGIPFDPDRRETLNAWMRRVGFDKWLAKKGK